MAMPEAEANYQRIKRYYLSRGRTEAQWLEVAKDPRKFNRVWRALLRLPPSNDPPPAEWR